MTKQMPHIKQPMHKEELQQRNHIEAARGKTAGGGGVEFKSVLLAQNRTLNSDTAQKYEYMLGPKRDPLRLLKN